MQLDDLQSTWAKHGERLERVLSLNEQVMRQLTVRKVRWSLTPYLLWRSIEIVFAIGVVAAASIVLARHVDEARYLAVTPVVMLFAIFMIAKTGNLMTRAVRLDTSAEVAAMQLAIEQMRRLEFHCFKWALLGGTVLWLPTALLLFEAAFGVAALARVHFAWLACNMVFGLLVLAIGQTLAKKHVERSNLTPAMRRLVDMISGKQLAAVSRHLDELASLAPKERA
jgi:hypothetical protein